MKKNIIILAIVLFCVILSAEMRSIDDAQLVCENFVTSMNKDFQVDNHTLMGDRSTNLIVFNLIPDGFVVTSADDTMYPVVAYSWLGSYDDNSKDDLQFRFIKEDQALRAEYFAASPELAQANRTAWQNLINGSRPDRDFQQWPMEGNTLTDGWCNTQWTQSGIFNEFCPLDTGGNRSVVGCVATAMSQIMHFHRYIGNPTFSNSDDYYSGWWDAIHIDNDHEEYDFPDWEELNGYLEIADEHYNNGEYITDQDLAAVCYAAGVSVEMGYSSEGSGAQTSDVAYALTSKFNFDSASWNDNSGTSFYNNLAEDMKEMQPAEFSIYTSGWNDGHAIVCDGYNTDDYFHLNFGWGSSNIGWYHLPAGMPSNYSIIGGAVRNIEGGSLPNSVSGTVSGPEDVSDAYILFSGDRFSYEAYADENGSFSIPALQSGWYEVSAVCNRVWYYNSYLEITSDLNNYNIQMFNYEAVTGQVSGTDSPLGTSIMLYDNIGQVAETTCDQYGFFSIPDILPGNYYANASLAPGYFGSNTFQVNPDNQSVNIQLMEYAHNSQISWYNTPEDIYSLVPITISCGIRITGNDLIAHGEDIFCGVSFIAPINEVDGSITAQLWSGDQLITSTPVDQFTSGELVQVQFPHFVPVDGTRIYYVGYEITTTDGSVAYHDQGPRVNGHGAFFRVLSWNELSDTFDFNFCIAADLLSTLVENDPETVQLCQPGKFNSAYPNPFSLSLARTPASISFSLDQNASISLDIYNIKGQKASSIYQGSLAAGSHNISWSPDNLSTGIYFYKLAVDGNTTDYLKTIIIK